LSDEPIVLIPWHLGAEPFTFAAVAYGISNAAFDLVVPGEPRDRRLLFPVALELAQWFNPLFESHWSAQTTSRTGELESVPQVWVPNEGAVTVLAKLGRRLAYLPTEASPDGPPPADPELVRFGRHLQFLTTHAATPGQQLILSATTLAAENWQTEQTVAERANLAALDAWIEPPTGRHGFDAAFDVETTSVGPLPPPSVEQKVARLIDEFNEARRSDNGAGMSVALEGQRSLYHGQSAPAWDLTWRVMERERRWPAEPRFITRRMGADLKAYADHMEWMAGPLDGRRRTRLTFRQAIRVREDAEEAKSLLEAEEAISDPIRMIPYLLDHKALEGVVISYDHDLFEVKPGNKRATRVPALTIKTDRKCLAPVGKELWWTERPDRVRVVVVSAKDDSAGPGSLVTLKVMEQLEDALLLQKAKGPVCFSQLKTKTRWRGSLPSGVPWTHQSSVPAESDQDIEDQT
jgi:hypothetical protein